MTMDSTYVCLIYVKTLAAIDLTYTIEQSSDLVDWTPANPINVILSDDGVIQTIKAQVPQSNAGSTGALYLRLSVSH